MSSTVKVGVGVLLVKANLEDTMQPLVLIGKRKGSHGSGTYSLPGGHLEYRESFEQCAVREITEETGIDLTPLTTPRLAFVTNDIIDATKHYVTVFMRADVPAHVEAQNMEPDKCDGWQWVPYNRIPEPLFAPLESLIRSDFKLTPPSATPTPVTSFP